MRVRRETNRVILHHSLSKDVSADTIRGWHMQAPRKWDDIGYHFVVRASGDIEIGRQMDLVGAHARGRNLDSIGICVAGDFRMQEPTQEQYASISVLLDFLTRVYGDLDVEPHRTRWNACPGAMFKWSLI